MPRVHNPDQLKLMMTGSEWQSTVTNSVDGSNLKKVWGRKESESRARPDSSYTLPVHDYSKRVDGQKPPIVGEIEYSDPHGAGMYDKIKDSGYRHNPADPPTIYLEGKAQIQGEGHHRIAAAAAVERDTGKASWIPTNYEKS